MATIVQKIKSALLTKSEKSISIEDRLSNLEKLAKAGKYDDGYGAPNKGNNPEEDPSQTGNDPQPHYDKPNAGAVPGVPGTAEEEMPEKRENYDDKYVAPKSEKPEEVKPVAEAEPLKPAAEECTCDKCGSKYKMKKAEDKDYVKPAVEEEMPEKKENYDDKYVAPKAEEKDEDKKEEDEDETNKKMKYAFSSFVPGQRMELAKPTKEELNVIKTKSFKNETRELFGKKVKSQTDNSKMTQWAMEQFIPKTPKK